MNLEVRKVADQAELESCAKMCADIFSTNEETMLTFCKKANINVSCVATIDGNIVGCCLLDTEVDLSAFIKNMTKKDSIEKYKDKRGVYVLTLAVKPEYQKKGVTLELIQWCRDLGYEYRWGLWNKQMVTKELIADWYSRDKQIVAETLTTYTVVSATTEKR